MKILVTGGAGFIGSHIVDAYIAAGHEVIVVDNLSTGNQKNLNPKATLHEIDIRNREKIIKLVTTEKPDIINHHAAQAAVTVSGASPAETYDINVTGTLNLLLASRGIKKFIFASTGGALYGDLKHGEAPFTENSPAQPLSAYGLSKLISEQLVSFYAHELKFEYTIFRYANAYGPRQNPKGEAGICAIFSKLLSEGKQPTIYNKDATRDYVFVSDISRANMLALTSGTNATLNIGTGKQITNQHVFETIAKEYSYKGTPRHEPARTGEVHTTAVNASLAQQKLGWHPIISFTEGIHLIHASQN